MTDKDITPADLLEKLCGQDVSLADAPGVYFIYNRESDKMYIGSSQNIRTRILSHFSLLLRNKHPNIYLQRTFNKYGAMSFMWDVCEIVQNEDNLLEVEQKYLDIAGELNILRVAGRTTGYRPSKETRKKLSARSSGANNPMYGIKRPEVGLMGKQLFTGVPLTAEHKAKISAALKGRRSFWDDPVKKAEVSRKIGDANRGRVLTPEHKAKISQAGIGRVFSEEHKDKLRAASTGRKHSEETKRLISASRLGKKPQLSEEDRQRRSERAKAISANMTPEQKAARAEKTAAKRRGKPISQEQKDKLSSALKGRKFSESHLNALREAGKRRAEENRKKKLL